MTEKHRWGSYIQANLARIRLRDRLPVIIIAPEQLAALEAGEVF